MTVSLRPAAASDRSFLLELYATIRDAELSLVDWDDATKRAFVQMQFEAQDSHYRTHYRNTSYDIVEVDGVPVGRLYVARWDDEMRVVDISLLPQWRGRGIGKQLFEDLMAEAAAAQQPLTIHVERQNPALRLYQRLGFTVTSEDDLNFFMTWRAQANTAS